MMHRSAVLDTLRGTALIGMVAYHTAYDLDIYAGASFDTLHGAWWVFARVTAILFLLVSGAVVVLAEERMQSQASNQRWLRRIRRTALTAGAAALVSAVTYHIDPETYVRFGILHLLAVSRLLLPCALPLKRWMLPLGIGVVVLGNMPWTADTSLLLPLGVIPPDFVSVDYFPLLPWFGIPLIGAGLISLHPIRALLLQPLPDAAPVRILRIAGRHTLVVYLLHQPLLFLLLGIPF